MHRYVHRYVRALRSGMGSRASYDSLPCIDRRGASFGDGVPGVVSILTARLVTVRQIRDLDSPRHRPSRRNGAVGERAGPSVRLVIAPAVATARLGNGRGPRLPGCPRTRRERPSVLSGGRRSADAVGAR